MEYRTMPEDETKINPSLNTKARLSSLSMITATLTNDMNSRYWALGLIRATHTAGAASVQTLHLKGLIAKTIFIFLGWDIMIHGMRKPITAAGFILMLAVCIGLEIWERQLIRGTTMAIIKRDFTDEHLKSKTFYQVAEQLSAVNGSVSLIDLISKSNTCLQDVFLVSLLIFFIPEIPLSILTAILFLLLASIKVVSLEILAYSHHMV